MGLVPPERKERVVEYVKSRGMACSVYAAQRLLDGLYDAGAEDYALHLMTATDTDRSWPHMIHDVGTTITLEAWDRKYKPNLDWNHAWGAAPANIIPRKLMGIEPMEPGFARARIIPRPGSLEQASVVTPTIRGPIALKYSRAADGTREYELSLPGNMVCELHLPADGPDLMLESGRALSEVSEVKYLGQEDGRAVLELGSGSYRFTVIPGL
jgi:hypothetical protein